MKFKKKKKKKVDGHILLDEIRSQILRNLLKMSDRGRERSRRDKDVMRRLAKVTRCPEASKAVT